MKQLLKTAVFGAIALFTLNAHAIIVSGVVFDIPTSSTDAFDQGGTFIELDPNATFSVGNDTFQTPNLYGFNEKQNVTFSTDLDYEYGADNANDDVLGSPLPGATNKGAGTLLGDSGDLFASHYIFFDPAGTRRIWGAVTFDADIAAVFTSTSSLLASDTFISPSNNVTYLNPSLRGLEPVDNPLDVIGNTLILDFTAASPGDYIRVLTFQSPGAPVPEASTFAVMFLGAALMLISRRRRIA